VLLAPIPNFHKGRCSTVFVLWGKNSPTRAYVATLLRFINHTWTQPHSSELLWTSDLPVACNSTSHHTTLTRDRLSYPKQDSRPQSQQTNDRRPTPLTAPVVKFHREKSKGNSLLEKPSPGVVNSVDKTRKGSVIWACGMICVTIVKIGPLLWMR